MQQRLKIAMIAAECVPFAKTGGLADVVGALPQALHTLGHEVIVVMPIAKSKTIDPNLEENDSHNAEKMLALLPL